MSSPSPPPPPGFAIETIGEQPGSVLLGVRGELDMSVAPELSAAIEKAEGSRTVLLDLSQVTFIDSSAIGALVVAGRHVADGGGRLQIGPRSEAVSRVLEITGLTGSDGAFDVLPESR